MAAAGGRTARGSEMRGYSSEMGLEEGDRQVGEVEPSEVQEVEVERLPRPGEAPGEDPRPRLGLDELQRAFGPVVAGLLVDLVDAATFTPLLGLALGVPIGYYLARQLGLAAGPSWKLALVVGLYCGVPGTLALPLGTLVGLWVKARELLG